MELDLNQFYFYIGSTMLVLFFISFFLIDDFEIDLGNIGIISTQGVFLGLITYFFSTSISLTLLLDENTSKIIGFFSFILAYFIAIKLLRYMKKSESGLVLNHGESVITKIGVVNLVKKIDNNELASSYLYEISVDNNSYLAKSEEILIKNEDIFVVSVKDEFLFINKKDWK